MTTKRILTGICAAAAALLLLTSCLRESDDAANRTSITAPSGPSGISEQGGAHNEADVEYVEMMIPHHEQALAMAELVPSRTGNPDIVALATQIEQTQAPQIEEMEGWLKAWGAPEPSDVATPPGSSPNGMEYRHGMSNAPGASPGMASSRQMQDLEAAKGEDFDRMWLQLMIRHHQAAVASSEQILTTGVSEQVRQLAQQIVTSQQAEIARMEQLLNQ